MKTKSTFFSFRILKILTAIISLFLSVNTRANENKETSIKNWNNLQNTNSTLKDKLKKPDYGNYLEHEKLFSGENKKLPGFTYDREWLLDHYGEMDGTMAARKLHQAGPITRFLKKV